MNALYIPHISNATETSQVLNSILNGNDGINILNVDSKGDFKVAPNVLGKDWVAGVDIVDDLDWEENDANTPDSSLVTASYDGHVNCVAILESSSGALGWIQKDISAQTALNYEGWVYVNTTNRQYFCQHAAAMASLTGGLKIQLGSIYVIDSGGNWYDSGIDITNGWYHFRVEWVKNTSCDYYMNGIKIYTKLPPNVDTKYLTIGIYTGAATQTAYFDAIAYSTSYLPNANTGAGVLRCKALVVNDELYVKPRGTLQLRPNHDQCTNAITTDEYVSFADNDTDLGYWSGLMPNDYKLGGKTTLYFVIYNNQASGKTITFQNVVLQTNLKNGLFVTYINNYNGEAADTITLTTILSGASGGIKSEHFAVLTDSTEFVSLSPIYLSLKRKASVDSWATTAYLKVYLLYERI
jgi:hypothetical protein